MILVALLSVSMGILILRRQCQSYVRPIDKRWFMEAMPVVEAGDTWLFQYTETTNEWISTIRIHVAEVGPTMATVWWWINDTRVTNQLSKASIVSQCHKSYRDQP